MRTIKVFLAAAVMLVSTLATAGSGGDSGVRRPLKADGVVAATPEIALHSGSK